MQSESLQVMAKKTEVMNLSQEVMDWEEKRRKEEGMRIQGLEEEI